MNKSHAAGIILIALAGILWGAMGTAVQHIFNISKSFTPLGLVAMRQLCAGLLFVAVATLISPAKTWAIFKDRRTLLDIVIGGVLVFTAHYTFFEAIFYSNAGTGAILLTTVPLFAALWLAFSKGQRLTLVEFICFLLASSGVALIVTNGSLDAVAFSPLALLWGLASAIIAAIYSIQPLRAIRKVGVTPVVAWGLLAGGIIGTCIAPFWTQHVNWTAETGLCFGYIVLFGTVAAFWCYMTGLKHVSPVVAGLLNCLEPLSAFFFSIVLLGDSMSAIQFLGVVLVMLNVCVLSFSKRGK